MGGCLSVCVSWKKTPVISWLLSFYILIITIPDFWAILLKEDQHPVLPWQVCWDIHTKICSGTVQETRKKISQVKPSNSQLSFWRINRNKLKLQKLQTTSHTTQRICCQFLSVRLQTTSPCLVLNYFCKLHLKYIFSVSLFYTYAKSRLSRVFQTLFPVMLSRFSLRIMRHFQVKFWVYPGLFSQLGTPGKPPKGGAQEAF